MTDTPPESDKPVLRPFTAPAPPDLPPVEGSSVVVPEPGQLPKPLPAVADELPAAPESADGPTAIVADATWAPEGTPAATDLPAIGQLVPDDEPVASPAADAATIPDALPAGDAAADSITLPRRTLTLAAGGAGLVIALLAFLWLNKGNGDDVAEPGGDGSPVTSDAPADGAGDDTRAGDLESEIATLTGQVGDLEAELAGVRPAALPGTALRRIVVAADASFVSLGNQGLAVIGPFGGYAAVDPATNTVTATAQVASGATRVMRTDSAVWVTSYTESRVVWFDPVANAEASSFDFPGPDGIAKLGGTLVVASFDGGFVAQVAPAAGEIRKQVDVGGKPSDVWVDADGSAIWVAIFDTGEVVRIDPASFEVTDRVTVGAGPVGLTAVDGVLWVANNSEGTVVGVDQATATVTSSIAVGEGPTATAVYGGNLWASVTDAGELVQIDRDSGEILTRTPLGSSSRGGPTGMTVGADSLWVAMQGERSVVRVTLPAG